MSIGIFVTSCYILAIDITLESWYNESAETDNA